MGQSIFVCKVPLINIEGFSCVVSGMVFGILLAFGIISLLLYFFLKRKKGVKK